jgi:hypothetical protein
MMELNTTSGGEELEAASKLLSKPKFAQIKEWVLELNSQVLSLLDDPLDPIPGF